MTNQKDDPSASWYGRVSITPEVRKAAAEVGVDPLLYAKSLDMLLAQNEALSRLIATPELERQLQGRRPTATSIFMEFSNNVDVMRIPLELIQIAKENPHLDWNEQMAFAVEGYSKYQDAIETWPKSATSAVYKNGKIEFR